MDDIFLADLRSRGDISPFMGDKSHRAWCIRQKFPEPVKKNNSVMGVDCYCVGGAYLLSMQGVSNDTDVRFPSHERLAEAFVEYEQVDEDTGSDAAWMIIRYNDAGDFKVAWDQLQRVLRNC